jgi:hypothetical protein
MTRLHIFLICDSDLDYRGLHNNNDTTLKLYKPRVSDPRPGNSPVHARYENKTSKPAPVSPVS